MKKPIAIILIIFIVVLVSGCTSNEPLQAPGGELTNAEQTLGNELDMLEQGTSGDFDGLEEELLQQ